LKTLSALFTCFLIVTICCVQYSYGAETVIVNQSFNNREIKVKIGSRIQVEVQTPAATTNVWTLKDLDGEHFKTIDPLVAGVWLIEAKKTGKANLGFILSPPGEEKNATEVITLRVLIVPTNSKR
jgi:hypothetical protein